MAIEAASGDASIDHIIGRRVAAIGPVDAASHEGTQAPAIEGGDWSSPPSTPPESIPPMWRGDHYWWRPKAPTVGSVDDLCRQSGQRRFALGPGWFGLLLSDFVSIDEDDPEQDEGPRRCCCSRSSAADNGDAEPLGDVGAIRVNERGRSDIELTIERSVFTGNAFDGVGRDRMSSLRASS